MSAKRSGGDGLKGHYEMIILVVVLIALLASGVYLVLRIGTEQASLKSGAEVDTPRNISLAQILDLSAQQDTLTELQEPFQSGEKDRRLMVSELRVRSVNKAQIPAPIPFDATVCPFTAEKQPTIREYDGDLDGIPDAVETKYGMDPKDPTDADLDMDGDGFTNIVEIDAGKDPTDPKSSPSILAKIRIARIIDRPFMMRFYGVQHLSADKVQFQLNLRTLDKTHFANMGDVVEGYKLVDFQIDVVTNGQKRIDRSRLILEKGGQRETLIKGQVRNKSEKFILLISLLDKETFRTRVGESFEYRDKMFDVKDISARGVTVFDRELNEITVVPIISSEEKAIIQGEINPDALQGFPDEMMRQGTQRRPVRRP